MPCSCRVLNSSTTIACVARAPLLFELLHVLQHHGGGGRLQLVEARDALEEGGALVEGAPEEGGACTRAAGKK